LKYHFPKLPLKGDKISKTQKNIKRYTEAGIDP